MTTCRDSLDLLLEYAEGHLPDDVRRRLEAHFGDCQPCEEFLKTYRATPGLCKKALAATMPEAVAKKLTTFLRRELQAHGDGEPKAE
ncbi:MAG: zf-HC2 domain-containing protein [Myxococcota bacterium]